VPYILRHSLVQVFSNYTALSLDNIICCIVYSPVCINLFFFFLLLEQPNALLWPLPNNLSDASCRILVLYLFLLKYLLLWSNLKWIDLCFFYTSCLQVPLQHSHCNKIVLLIWILYNQSKDFNILIP
jgi:hypothetical protein